MAGNEWLASLWGADPRMSRGSNIVKLKKIRLLEPFEVNVAEIARHFSEYFHRKPFESSISGKITSELIRTEGEPGKTRSIFEFDGKTDQGFTEISTDLSSEELFEHLNRLPESLAIPLRGALVAAGVDLPSVGPGTLK